MANVNHSTLTDPYLHEPKGVASAGAGELYYANGTGSGSWLPSHVHCTAYAGFNKAGIASLDLSTVNTIVPTSGYTLFNNEGFQLISAGASTGAGLEYTGTPDIHCTIMASFSIKQSSGGNADVEVAIKEEATGYDFAGGSRFVVTSTSGEWHQITTFAQGTLSQNDGFYIGINDNISSTVIVASAMIRVMGIPEV